MLSRTRALLASLTLALASCGGDGMSPSFGPPPNILDGKVIANYQGWFGCPGDFEDNPIWLHWFYGGATASLETITVDMLPDASQLPASSLCDTGLPLANGDTLKVFSSMDPALVDHHFKQMADNGVGAVNLQRFVNELASEFTKRRRDRVLENALAAAQRNALPLHITYDISGADPKTVVAQIRQDWKELNEKHDFTRNPGYLRDNGRPVLEIWGFGFIDRPGEPEEVIRLLGDLKDGAGAPAAFLIGGVPSRWTDLAGDSKSDPRWLEVYGAYDVVSPWWVGRYSGTASASLFIQTRMATQRRVAELNGQAFLPVIFPGFSWRNLSTNAPYMTRQGPLNQIPRECGRFFRQQLQEIKAQGARSVQVAMFDEMDESTAMLPTLANKDGVPLGAVMLTLDQDGCTLPSDHYLGELRNAAQVMR